MSEGKTYKGACLCGAVSYEISEFTPEMGHCHCSMCRQFSGAAFSTFATVPRKAFRWLSGEADLKAYLASNGTTRQFCQHCGSSMTFASPKEQYDVIELALGSLQTPLDTVFPDAHIYYDNKANWFTPNDTLSKFPQYRDGDPL